MQADLATFLPRWTKLRARQDQEGGNDENENTNPSSGISLGRVLASDAWPAVTAGPGALGSDMTTSLPKA